MLLKQAEPLEDYILCNLLDMKDKTGSLTKIAEKAENNPSDVQKMLNHLEELGFVGKSRGLFFVTKEGEKYADNNILGG